MIRVDSLANIMVLYPFKLLIQVIFIEDMIANQNVDWCKSIRHVSLA